MTLNALDWSIIALFLAASAAIGVYYTKRAGQDAGEFFLSGRNLPWWLVGTSMVATTFAADTPLAVAGLVARNGVSGNWVWWSFAFGGALTIFFFARLWRRAGITTDVELVELRYTGRGAAFLRGFRAVWLGLFINCAIMAWVNLAMAKIMAVTLGWDKLTAVLACMVIAGVYSAMSGLWGVVVTDLFQFLVAMVGCVVLAVVAVDQPAIGGLSGLVAKSAPRALDFFPDFGNAALDGAAALGLSPFAFLAFVALQWWSSWYPGSEPGGGGYIAQRLMAARNENHAFASALWFTLAHYCLRPWPWIVVGLVAAITHPGLADPESGYVLVMRDVLPPGLRGLMVGAFLAAYMSTISTHLNWGASYLVNDLYGRFINRDADQRQLVRASRVATLLAMVMAAITTFFIDSVSGAWTLVLESSSGIGLVLLLRWYWWRVNAWSEIAAMAASVVGFIGLKLFTSLVFPATLLVQTLFTTVVWLTVTYATRPEPLAHLCRFYERVRPTGPGWRPVARRMGLSTAGDGRSPAQLLSAWLLSCALIYGALFSVGAWLFQRPREALVWGAVTFASAALLYWLLRRPTSRVPLHGRASTQPDAMGSP